MKAAQQGTDDTRVDMTFIWRCPCGGKNFNHVTWCGSCSNPRPAPPEKGKQKGKK